MVETLHVKRLTTQDIETAATLLSAEEPFTNLENFSLVVMPIAIPGATYILNPQNFFAESDDIQPADAFNILGEENSEILHQFIAKAISSKTPVHTLVKLPETPGSKQIRLASIHGIVLTNQMDRPLVIAVKEISNPAELYVLNNGEDEIDSTVKLIDYALEGYYFRQNNERFAQFLKFMPVVLCPTDDNDSVLVSLKGANLQSGIDLLISMSNEGRKVTLAFDDRNADKFAKEGYKERHIYITFRLRNTKYILQSVNIGSNNSGGLLITRQGTKNYKFYPLSNAGRRQEVGSMEEYFGIEPIQAMVDLKFIDSKYSEMIINLRNKVEELNYLIDMCKFMQVMITQAKRQHIVDVASKYKSHGSYDTLGRDFRLFTLLNISGFFWTGIGELNLELLNAKAKLQRMEEKLDHIQDPDAVLFQKAEVLIPAFAKSALEDLDRWLRGSEIVLELLQKISISKLAEFNIQLVLDAQKIILNARSNHRKATFIQAVKEAYEQDPMLHNNLPSDFLLKLL